MTASAWRSGSLWRTGEESYAAPGVRDPARPSRLRPHGRPVGALARTESSGWMNSPKLSSKSAEIG
jgi:hypothetical protein